MTPKTPAEQAAWIRRQRAEMAETGKPTAEMIAQGQAQRYTKYMSDREGILRALKIATAPILGGNNPEQLQNALRVITRQRQVVENNISYQADRREAWNPKLNEKLDEFEKKDPSIRIKTGGFIKSGISTGYPPLDKVLLTYKKTFITPVLAMTADLSQIKNLERLTQTKLASVQIQAAVPPTTKRKPGSRW